MKKIRNIMYVVGGIIIIYFVITMIIPSNSMVKKFGGTATMDLPVNTKLVNATWKDDELWILTREMKETESAESYKFSEKSKWGVLEGTYVFVEKK